MASLKNRKTQQNSNQNSLYNYFSDNRPACKYGDSCYQKNEDHVKAFKHDKKVKVSHDLGQTKRRKTEASPAKEAEPTPNNKKINLELLENINSVYMVKFPSDIFDFLNFCKTISSENPCDALVETLGLKLVGPFEFLSGSHIDLTESDKTNLFCKWRFYYDPPEYHTIIICIDSETLYHLGYYWDDPKIDPVFVGSNEPGKTYSNKSGHIIPKGDNIFSAIWHEMEEVLKRKSKSGKTCYNRLKNEISIDKIENLQSKLEVFFKKLDQPVSLMEKEGINKRQKSIVAKTFHGAGIVVPLSKSGVGYREIPENNTKLRKICEAVNESQQNSGVDTLQELMTLVQFANDECDYGMGLELGLDLFTFGGSALHPYVTHLLSVAYELLNRQEFQKILVTHLEKRTSLRGAHHWK